MTLYNIETPFLRGEGCDDDYLGGNSEFYGKITSDIVVLIFFVNTLCNDVTHTHTHQYMRHWLGMQIISVIYTQSRACHQSGACFLILELFWWTREITREQGFQQKHGSEKTLLTEGLGKCTLKQFQHKSSCTLKFLRNGSCRAFDFNWDEIVPAGVSPLYIYIIDIETLVLTSWPCCHCTLRRHIKGLLLIGIDFLISL